MAKTPTPRPWRPLGVLAMVLAALYGGLALLGTWSPRLGLDLEGGTSVTLTASTTDGEAPSAESMSQALDIIRSRVNGSGVSEAEVSTQGSSSIVVSMPDVGEDDLVEMVGQTAELRFRPVRAVVDGAGPVEQLEQPDPSASPSASSTATPTPTPTPSASATPPADLPLSDATGPPTPEEQAALTGFSCDDVETGAADDPKLSLYTCDQDNTTRFLLGPADVVGTDVESATAAIPQGDVSWVVNLQFTGEGSDKFYASTQALSTQAPPQNSFAIVLDGQVVTYPEVTSAIPGGQATISGSFDQKSAQRLATVLNYGALPLTFETSDVSTVTPTLGATQLEAGLIAGAIGLGLVLLYSLIYYRGLGFVVMASLIVAGGLTYGLLVLLGEAIGFTLTIAGIAGIIVSIGITADSFVVFFERIRDEIREGRSVRMAVETGWDRARRTILTSDAVSLLAAFFLYVFSVANVRGFAFALGLTTLVDLVIVFLFTKPFVTVLARSRFFGTGHPWSGLDPERLGAPRRVGLAGRRRPAQPATEATAEGKH